MIKEKSNKTSTVSDKDKFVSIIGLPPNVRIPESVRKMCCYRAIAALTDKAMALLLANLTYRNTSVIEDSHSLNRKMDMAFFEEAKETVNEKFQELLTTFDNVQKGRPPANIIEEEFLFVLVAYSTNGEGWDEPVIIDAEYTGNVGDYVLGGEFLKACQNGEKIGSQQLMKRLNKEVHSRYYTLVHDCIINLRVE